LFGDVCSIISADSEANDDDAAFFAGVALELTFRARTLYCSKDCKANEKKVLRRFVYC
jgi:hypothetical protein